MPVKFWEERPDGSIGSRIVTGWDTTYYGEEFRPEAEDLDQRLDEVLDAAVELTHTTPVTTVSADPKFKMIWCFGRAVKDSGVLTHPALKSEKQRLLWRAMAAKARLGISSDFSYLKNHFHDRWRELRRARGQRDVPNKDGGVQDMYETAIWLQQHELAEAAFLFGGKLGNAREIGARKGVNMPILRRALLEWFKMLLDAQRETLHQKANFQLIAKALTKRWPFRGFGSARRPEHMPYDDLLEDTIATLQPVVNQIISS